MKREELIEYKADENFGNGLVYSIIEVNQVLDEKDVEIAELKAKLESVQASAYADSVDAGMRERRLKRALYNACANWASCKACLLAVVGSELYAKKWERMFNKCLKEAEEYK